jgi:hypothetical protein
VQVWHIGVWTNASLPNTRAASIQLLRELENGTWRGRILRIVRI